MKNTVIRLDGTTSKNRAKIKNISVSENYIKSNENGYKVLKIGNSDQTLIGNHKYTIKYNYNIGKDPLKNMDEFYFNLIGNEWDTSIDNVTFKITMPKSFDKKLVGFSSGRKGSTDNVNVNYAISGNTISGSYNKTLSAGEGLTIRCTLDEGYFVGAKNNIGIINIIGIIIVFTSFITCLINYFLYNEKIKKYPQTVEFYSPDNLSPAELGYINSNYKTNIKQSISLLFTIANKGYIQINDKQNNIEVINLYPKPQEDKNIYNNLPKRCIEIMKLRNPDESLNHTEKMAMDYWFKNSNNKKIIANFNKFDEVKDDLVNNGFIQIISDNIEEIQKEKEKYKDVVALYEKKVIEYENNIKKLPPLSNYEKELYDNLFKLDTTIKLNSCSDVYYAVQSINYALENNLKNIMINPKAYKKKKSIMYKAIIMLIISVGTFIFLREFPIHLYTLEIIMSLITLLSGIIMNYKTNYGEEIKARIEGFKNFLILAEKNKLEELVMENSSYFYDILPYTYALNISNKWVKKFENIKIPHNEYINFNYNDYSYYNRMERDFYKSIQAHKSYINSSYGGFGGYSSYSGSSSSGGGSSGGGSGGGGGGSW